MKKTEKIKLCLKYSKSVFFKAWKREIVEAYDLTLALIISLVVVFFSILSAVFYPIKMFVESFYIGLTVEDQYIENLRAIVDED